MTEKSKNKSAESEEKETQIYELGYHIIPTISEEDVPAEVEKIKKILEEHGALLIGEEEMPKSINLAYPIEKKISNKKHIFEAAYFGWMKFEALPNEIPTVDKKVKDLDKILRFIIIKTVRASKVVAGKNILKKRDKKKPDKSEEKKKKEKSSSKEGGKEVDEAIDELVIE